MTGTSILAFIEGIGGPELMMILFVVLILFGGQKLPELAKGLGKSMREFKKAASGVEEEFKRAIEETPDPATPPRTPARKPPPDPPAT
ncbi:MAG: twin-arginine translocase TatA/TatE family subunit [Opitutaceae bacterium]|nr:twin-arginine translocase TatA/TatE family subunit [Opitutaceae bacterium]